MPLFSFRYAFLAALCCLFNGATGYSQTIVTLAGNGSTGYSGDGGAATAAQLYFPFGVAVDNSGNCYISDQANNRVRLVGASGSISTFAGTGSGSYGGDGGPATSAQIDFPQGVLLYGGNLFIADADNEYVRKVSSTFTMSSLAGNGSGGYSGDGGAATAAELNFPTGLAADASGNVYLADCLNNRIRKITPSGAISTVAGNGTSGFGGDGGPATAAQLNHPSGIVFDRNGNMYIADKQNNRIRKVSTSGNISTYAGIGTAAFSGDGGPATTAQLNAPTGIAIDTSGNLYVADCFNNCIRKIAGGGITTVAGTTTSGYSGDGGPATAARLNAPTGIALDAQGNMYIADQQNNVVRKVFSATAAVPQTRLVAAPAMAVFPNPGRNSFSVMVSAFTAEMVSVTVSDLAGNLVTHFKATTNSPRQVQLDLPAGTYLFEALTGSGKAVQKVVVY